MVRKRIRSKKATLQDLIYVAVILLVFAFGTLIAFKISDEINDKFQASTQLEAQGKTAMDKINNMYPGVVDNSFLFLTVGLCIVALVMAAMVRVHPVFFVFYLILLVIVIFLCGVFSNIYMEAANQAELTALAEQLTFTTQIMHVLPFLVGIFGFVLAIIMYKTWREGQ